MKFLPLSLSLLTLALLSFQSPGADKKPAGQPDPQEMMTAQVRAGTPGAQHKALEPFIGTWSAEVAMYMDPSMPPMESTGTMVNSWIYGGRYLEHKFEGDFGGMKFEGSGLWGFDIAAGKYIGIWYDSMSTSVMHSSGPVSKDGKTWTMASTNTDPMTGKDSTGEEVITLDSPTQHTMTMYGDVGGKKVKRMEIVYTKKK